MANGNVSFALPVLDFKLLRLILDKWMEEPGLSAAEQLDRLAVREEVVNGIVVKSHET
jgi:hypothetical protein